LLSRSDIARMAADEFLSVPHFFGAQRMAEPGVAGPQRHRAHGRTAVLDGIVAVRA